MAMKTESCSCGRKTRGSCGHCNKPCCHVCWCGVMCVRCSTTVSMARITAEDLYLLCRRASYALSKDRPEDAEEILAHAVRIGKRIGIEDKIMRTCS